jgi:hypothetical protein
MLPVSRKPIPQGGTKMAETKCGFCKGTVFEYVPLQGVNFGQLLQCAQCGHPVGILYESMKVDQALNKIAEDVRSLKP